MGGKIVGQGQLYHQNSPALTREMLTVQLSQVKWPSRPRSIRSDYLAVYRA